MSEVPAPLNSRSRLTWAAVGAVCTLLLLGLTWGASLLIKSPQEALAEAAPPPPSIITYPVKTKDANGQQVLVVPISAIFTASDGAAKVVVMKGRRPVEIAVDMGANVDGIVQITPHEDGALTPDDEVLVSEPPPTDH